MKLLHLLKKDVLLMWRSKTWTIFETTLPVVLIGVFGLLLGVLLKRKESSNSDKDFRTTDLMITDLQLNDFGCGKMDMLIYVDSPDRTKIMKDLKGFKCSDGDKNTHLPAYIIEQNFSSTFIVPSTKAYKYFLNHQYYVNKLVFGNKTASKNFDQQLFKLPPPNVFTNLVALLFPLIFGICLTMPVMSLVRNVVVEKESVKPYLGTIGLPVWLFYVEHFLFGCLKTSILFTLCSSFWVILIKALPSWLMLGVFFLSLNSMAFALLLSSLITSAKRANEIVVVAWITCLVLSIIFADASLSMHYLLNLNPLHAFAQFLKALGYAAGVDGMKFEDMFSSRSDRLPCSAVFLGYLIGNTIVMFILALFMENIVSFIVNLLLKQLWKRLGKIGSGANVGASSKKTNSRLDVGVVTILNCEEKVEHRAKAPADIELTGLVKVYPNGERAVNGLSLRALRGQVSILLGHNGCGKSTTFGMITGMHKATEGTVVIGDINANHDRAAARKLIGYCPQYNPLYDKLTVWEHLRLANALKGCDSSNFEMEATSLLESIGLMPKKNEQSRNLSGGMKRKLCVCMAMIGGSQVILLDEPTAGMDPAARIDVQKMLMKEKEKRTILLTTHYMDEAEKLGDWVFVMSHGKMAASGSIHYLKQKYGDGMLLTLVFKNTTDLKKCYQTGYEVVKHLAPSAKIKDERGQMVEISMSVTEKSKLPTLLACLEAIMDKSAGGTQSLPANLQDQVRALDVVTIGVSMSSLEQVFIRIGDECDAIIENTNVETKKTRQRQKFVALLEVKARPPISGINFMFQKLVALLEKRVYYSYRNVMQIVFQVVLPLATLWFIAKLFHDLSADSALTEGVQYESLAIDTLPVSTVVVQMQQESDDRFVEFLKKYKNLVVYKENYATSMEDVVSKYTMGLQPLAFVAKFPRGKHASFYVQDDDRVRAVVMNVMASALYMVTAKEIPKFDSMVIWVLTGKNKSSGALDSTMSPSMVFSLLLVFVVIQSVTFLVEERMCKFSHQQLLTGLSSQFYWIAISIWDVVLFFLLGLYAMIFIWAFASFGSYSGQIFLLIMMLFAVAAPLVYLVSIMINSPSKASFLLFIHLSFSLISFMITIFIFSDDVDVAFTVMMIFRFINPEVAFMIGVMKTAMFVHAPEFQRMFFKADTIWEMNALVIELLFLAGFSVIFTILLCVFSTKSVRRGCFSLCHSRSTRRDKRVYKGFEACSAVGEEEKLIQNVNRQEKTVVIDGLIKDFGKFRAVNGLSVTVGHEECFGMLGANGAGKTTTFDIITGLQYPTGGTVTIDGKNITRNIHIGYCPQFDAMLQQISGRQVLRIMARLQGYTNVNELVEIVLECVGMMEHGDKLVKNCSGGQKRKISVGIALLSRATCIILDEPTAGIDPRARREIWDILHAMREQAKCSIILTSHSMEECEALCTRIGVLRTGEMIALGTSQSLKSQYGNTYMMTLVVQKLADRESVSKMVSSEMPNAVLKTPESNLTTSLVWELPRLRDDKWSHKYAQVEALARRAGVQDYMLTQASLEDTFIRLNTSD